MANKDPLWIKVEMSMAMWCCFEQADTQQANFNAEYHCSCPSQTQLQKASPEALERLLTALDDGTYVGDWQTYLEPQS